jgi:hypothetical protein
MLRNFSVPARLMNTLASLDTADWEDLQDFLGVQSSEIDELRGVVNHLTAAFKKKKTDEAERLGKYLEHIHGYAPDAKLAYDYTDKLIMKFNDLYGTTFKIEGDENVWHVAIVPDARF